MNQFIIEIQKVEWQPKVEPPTAITHGRARCGPTRATLTLPCPFGSVPEPPGPVPPRPPEPEFRAGSGDGTGPAPRTAPNARRPSARTRILRLARPSLPPEAPGPSRLFSEPPGAPPFHCGASNATAPRTRSLRGPGRALRLPFRKT